MLCRQLQNGRQSLASDRDAAFRRCYRKLLGDLTQGGGARSRRMLVPVPTGAAGAGAGTAG
jgi:hypothetical protein